MSDVVDAATRSRMMAGIRSGNTRPEILVRKFLHSAGFRFRLHRKDLPGKPDIVLSKHNLAVFVHGCFWHRHRSCFYAYTPKARMQFWQAKFDGNIERDACNTLELVDRGWRVLVIWECGLKHCAGDMQFLSAWVQGRERYAEWPDEPPRLS